MFFEEFFEWKKLAMHHPIQQPVALNQPKRILIISKSITSHFSLFIKALCDFLLSKSSSLVLFLDHRFLKLPLFQHALKEYPNRLVFWTPELLVGDKHLIDQIITLGGDGTVLYAAWLFQHSSVYLYI